MNANVDLPSGAEQAYRTKIHGIEALRKIVVREVVVKPASDVMRQGDVPTFAHLLLAGHTYRYRRLNDGHRQITAILMPGDMCDLEAVMLGRADYGVGALSTCVLGEIPVERIAGGADLDPDLTRVLWRRLLRDEAISREWLVRMGRRDALEKVAHLICEFRVRLEAVDAVQLGEFAISPTREELANVLAMSATKFNCVIRKLCDIGLIEIMGEDLIILDLYALEYLAGFDAKYLL